MNQFTSSLKSEETVATANQTEQINIDLSSDEFWMKLSDLIESELEQQGREA